MWADLFPWQPSDDEGRELGLIWTQSEVLLILNYAPQWRSLLHEASSQNRCWPRRFWKKPRSERRSTPSQDEKIGIPPGFQMVPMRPRKFSSSQMKEDLHGGQHSPATSRNPERFSSSPEPFIRSITAVDGGTSPSAQ